MCFKQRRCLPHRRCALQLPAPHPLRERGCGVGACTAADRRFASTAGALKCAITVSCACSAKTVMDRHCAPTEAAKPHVVCAGERTFAHTEGSRRVAASAVGSLCANTARGAGGAGIAADGEFASMAGNDFGVPRVPSPASAPTAAPSGTVGNAGKRAQERSADTDGNGTRAGSAAAEASVRTCVRGNSVPSATVAPCAPTASSCRTAGTAAWQRSAFTGSARKTACGVGGRTASTRCPAPCAQPAPLTQPANVAANASRPSESRSVYLRWELFMEQFFLSC